MCLKKSIIILLFFQMIQVSFAKDMYSQQEVLEMALYDTENLHEILKTALSTNEVISSKTIWAYNGYVIKWMKENAPIARQKLDENICRFVKKLNLTPQDFGNANLIKSKISELTGEKTSSAPFDERTRSGALQAEYSHLRISKIYGDDLNDDLQEVKNAMNLSDLIDVLNSFLRTASDYIPGVSRTLDEGNQIVLESLLPLQFPIFVLDDSSILIEETLQRIKKL